MKSDDRDLVCIRLRLGIISSYAASIASFRGALIREIVALGFTVFVLAPDYDEDSRAAVISLGAVPVDYTLSRAGINPLFDAINTARLWLKLRSLKLGVTLGYFIKPVIYGTLAARMASVPKRFALIEGAGSVFTQHARWSLRRSILRVTVVGLYKLSLSYADRVFVLNRDDEELFVRTRMVRTEKVQRIPGIGLDLAYYRQMPPSSDPMVFLFIGRLLREKGVQEFVEAARKVKHKYPEVQFVILGATDSNPSSFGPEDIVTWTADGTIDYPGYVSDVRTWLAKSSVFVLPSYREGMPRSTQEAMAIGRPVITTDVPGCRQTVTEGVNGFLVPAQDSEALAAAMLKFVEQPEIIVSMGLESRRMAESRFDVHRINAVIMKTMGLDEARN